MSKLFGRLPLEIVRGGSPRVQRISGGGCVLVTSFLTCPLLLQLFDPDLLPFETRSDFFDQTGQKSKNQLKIVGQVFATPLQNGPYAKFVYFFNTCFQQLFGPDNFCFDGTTRSFVFVIVIVQKRVKISEKR